MGDYVSSSPMMTTVEDLAMKTARQIKFINPVQIVIECSVCGAAASVKASMDTLTA